jgi:predicted metal-dependent phosphoesterase TrpH
VRILNDLTLGTFDLHIHTTASDGQLSPEEAVTKAASLGLSTIAITDHDTLAGVEGAIDTGVRNNIHVIPAVELSAYHEGLPVDVLGYNLAKWHSLHEYLHAFRNHRTKRAQAILRRLTSLGFPLTIEEVKTFSGSGVITRPHIARAMVKKGYVPDSQAAFDRFLADDQPAAVPKRNLTVREAIHLIHDHGGVAVLAHPALLAAEDQIEPLLHEGFDGIEAWHRAHTPEQVQQYLQLAGKYNRVVTGGSDFHREGHPMGKFISYSP